MTAASRSIARWFANAAHHARTRAVPREAPLRSASLLAHAAARAHARVSDEGRSLASAAAQLVIDWATLEGSAILFGPGAIIAEGRALRAPTFLPDYHGPHFERALWRLLRPHEGPFVVHLSMTGTCPWTCRYCFASAGGPGAPDLGDDVVRVAKALAKQRVPIVILGGGEPLGRFERTIAVIEQLAHASEVRLATSGSGLTPDRARRLSDAGLKVLAISLDSSERAVMDAARGEGAFDTAIRALALSRDAAYDTLVTAVVSRETFARDGAIEALLELVARTNPRAVVNFLPEFATGRSSEGFRTPEEYAPFAATLDGVIRAGRYRAAAFYSAAMERLVGCVGAGQRQLVIDTRANLSACVSGASFGNLLEEPFDLVWRRMLAAPSRLKRGYFCAAVNAREEALPRDEQAMIRALRAFHDSHEDAWLQPLISLLDALLPRSARGHEGIESDDEAPLRSPMGRAALQQR